FRFVTIPGPVLVQALISQGPNGEVYRPAKNDPKRAENFMHASDAKSSRVIETKPDDGESKLAIEIEPAPRMAVKVLNNDGTPVIGPYATGVTEEFYDRPEQYPNTDTLTVYNVEPGQE